MGRRRTGDPHRGAARRLARRRSTLTPRAPYLEPNRQTYSFGAGVAPDGNEVWFRIDSEAIHRMREKTPSARGVCLVDALITWMTPDRQLGPELNRFQVGVSDDGNTWIERYGD